MGSNKLIQELQTNYGIGDGDTTADGELTVQVVNGCLGMCDHAPVAHIGHDTYGNLTVESLNEAIRNAIAAHAATVS
jgi:NADH-quinone oxidoreductase subunit E